MRVISGKARSIKLYSLEDENTKPTLDRVKEALFSKLHNSIIDSVVLDIFAGSGALGIEALSRGAKEVIFCDSNKKAIDIINKNLLKTKLEAKVINKNYEEVLKELSGNYRFDMIFLDPPYDSNYYYKSLKLIDEFKLLKNDGQIILEVSMKNKEAEIEKISKLNYEIKDLKKYGTVCLIILNWKG